MLREKQPIPFNIMKSVHHKLCKAAAARTNSGALTGLAILKKSCILGMNLPIRSHLTLNKLINHHIPIYKIKIIFFLPPHKIHLKI